MAVVVILSLWMLSGLLRSDASSEPEENPDDEPMAVEVQTPVVEAMDRKVTLQGQMEPVRHLRLKAETSGTVEKIHFVKGTRVNEGDPLVTLDIGGRQNALAEARARVKTARSEQSAAQSLRQRGLQSQLQLEQAEASLEAALAQLGTIELDIANTTITAPFAAIVNDIPVVLGTLIERGDPVAELVDNSQFNVSAQASQQLLSSLKLGQDITVEMITGQNLTGKLSFISSVADSQTRSFKVEARIDNTDGGVAAGVSASLHIPVERVNATFISPSSLSLGDAGELGIKAVDSDNKVLFLPIRLVSTSLDGAWVTGIPAHTQVITLGQGFVNTGEVVDPRPTSNQPVDQSSGSPTTESKP